MVKKMVGNGVPSNPALELYKKHSGCWATYSKAPLRNLAELAVVYTPGIAEPCKIIKEDESLSFDYTPRGNMVAVLSNGTRVLGLGNIGAAAGIPVMTGKSILFKNFADVDACPVMLNTEDKETFIFGAKLLEKNYGAINLEDIKSPDCYEIEDRLKKMLDIPVFHDDQHGTAIACLSAVVGALRLVKKNIKTAKFVVNGCGAAGSAVGRLLLTMGAKNVLMVERWGILYDGMDAKLDNVQKDLAKRTNKKKIKGDLKTAAKGADVLIGLSGPGLFTKDIMKSMAKDAIVFGMANPVPEMTYADAKAAGVRVAGTGRSDTPNQVNNVTVFPGVFRGALDVHAREITEEMKVAAVYAIADLIDKKDLRDDYVVPSAFDERVAPAVAAAVAAMAIKQGVARKKVNPETVRKNTAERVAKYRKEFNPQ